MKTIPAVLGVALLCSEAVAAPPAHALPLSAPAGWYQINSGSYTLIGGIWGTLTQHLPNHEQALARLAGDGQTGQASLSLLSSDRRTPFLLLTNGVSTPEGLRFRNLATHPYPGVPLTGEREYLVTYRSGTLLIEGHTEFPPICCDIPYRMEHAEVQATALPELSVRVSEIELCWSSEPERVYQLQYRSAATGDAWVNLGPPTPGDGPTTCRVDRVTPADSARLYRVVVQP